MKPSSVHRMAAHRLRAVPVVRGTEYEVSSAIRAKIKDECRGDLQTFGIRAGNLEPTNVMAECFREA